MRQSAGASNALGYIYARCLHSDRGVLPQYVAKYHRQTVEMLYGLLTHRNLGVIVAAVRALGNIARFVPLPIPDGDMDIDTPAEQGSAPTAVTKKAIVAKMIALLKTTTSERRLTERIVVALGRARLYKTYFNQQNRQYLSRRTPWLSYNHNTGRNSQHGCAEK